MEFEGFDDLRGFCVPWPPAGWLSSDAHPDSPAGGGGPGRFTSPGPLQKGGATDPRSPASRHHRQHQTGRKHAATRVIVPTTKRGFLDAISTFEGNVPHMYLDTKGLVTIGIGFLIQDKQGKLTDEAKEWPFLVRGTTTKATEAQIQQDFDSVKARPSGAGIVASSFKSHTKLELSSTKVDELFQSKVDEFWKQLQAEFGSAFDSYPMPVQYALLDMIFNLGRGKETTDKDGKVKASGLHAYKKLRHDLDNKDWKKAGKDSHRNGPSAARNNAIKAWFESGADAEHATPQTPTPLL